MTFLNCKEEFPLQEIKGNNIKFATFQSKILSGNNNHVIAICHPPATHDQQNKTEIRYSRASGLWDHKKGV